MNGQRASSQRPSGQQPEDVQATFCATLVDEWVRCGMTDAVACPGSRSTPLTLAFAADDRVRVHVHHDERSAAFFALGLGAASGRPAVVVTTSGTATVNMAPAVVEAGLAGVPMLVCTADRPPELRDVAAPQTVDQIHLYGRSVRWFADPGVADQAMAGSWRSIAGRAWAESTGPWPGPVQVNLAFREPLVGTPSELPVARVGPWHHRASAVRTRPVLDRDVAAARGIVVAGRSTPDPDAVVELAGTLGWPLLADPLSGCRSRHSVVAFDSLLRSPFASRVEPEVVIRSGGLPASKVLSQFLAGSGAHEIAILPVGWWADPNRTASVLVDAVPAAPDGHLPVDGWREAWSEADALAQVAIDEVLDAAGLTEPGIARHLTATLPAGSTLVVSSSMPVRDVEWFGVPRADLRVLANRGANGIDGVLSTAAGVAANGARTTLLVGDLAFLHDVNGLLGSANRQLDLTIVVVDNDGGGIFHFLPQRSSLAADRFERLFGTPHGLDLVAVAEAHGVPARRVSALDELAWEPGVRVLVATTDRDDNVIVHDRLHQAVADAVMR